MLSVSNDFKQAMKQPVKQIQAYIRNNAVDIRDDNDLIQFKISADSGLCKTTMRKLEAKYIGEHNILGQWVHAGFGVKLPSGTYEYLDFGTFLVTEITTSKDTGTTNIVGYDGMIRAMTQYQIPLNITYPIGLYDYTVLLCHNFGMAVENASFDVHNNWQITQDLWSNIDGITYRDILQQIAQVTCTTVIITSDNKIYFKPINETNESLTYDNLMKLKLEPMYGEINSVVLAREPQNDNIYMSDEESITENGLTEWKISNNEIIDKDRDNAMTPIYNAMHGIKYYPFEANTEGLGWYEIGDNIDIENNEGDIFNTTIFNITITIDGGVKEVLKTKAETKTQTQYQYATTIAKRVKNTEIITDKQQQEINALVTDMYEEDGIVHENFTQIHQDINNIVQSVQNSGGANLIKNSVMFAYDNEGNPTNWDTSGAGTLVISASAEAMANGGLSGHVFTLNDKTVKQRVKVRVSDDNDPNKTYYTFSTKIKKNTTGSCYVKLFNSIDEYIINIPIGESAYYKEYTLQAILPKDEYFDIEFYGSADSDATFTDNMLSVGEYKTQWQQASGEVMNTQVNINLDGVLIKSSVYLGDYTVMSPLEFAGYSNVNGTVTKVFSLNKDTTEVEKLKAKKQMSMPPIKIVPITTGSLQGWAFVPTTEEV
ncbi:MAG: hypothetical protein J6Y29_03770 [Clostridiales bacterium]|nr:hypothetical protein [Clostridiales bacterium]